MKYILKENILLALMTAIVIQEKSEKQYGFTGDSAYLAGLRASLEELKNNNLQIKYT
jgi:hypothetical protein